MKKNTAGQFVGVQMCSATDGSAFTGAVTVYVTGDAGVQAVGSVGAGACTHEGNGFHTYAPAQAETNYDHVAFTFIGTGAIPATVQVYTSFPQTGDNFARLGAPAGASVSADVAAIKTETATILADTNDIQTRLPAALVGGRIDASVGAMAADVVTDAAVAADVTIASVTGAVGSVTAGVTVTTNNDKTGYGLSAAAVQAVWDALTTALTTVGSIGKKLADWTIGTAQTGDAFARLGAPAGASVSADIAAAKADTAAIKAKTDNLPAAPAAVSDIPTAAAVADQVWDELLSGHAIVGSTGAALSAAGGSGDPWATALPGAYGAGTAGKIIGDNINATISSRASQTSVDTVAGYVDTEVAAIKAKTDLIPAAPAAVGDIPTAIENADALLNRDMSTGTDSGSPTVRTVRQALRFLRNKWSIAGTTLTVTKEDDITASWTATVSTTAGADPVTGSDPA